MTMTNPKLTEISLSPGYKTQIELSSSIQMTVSKNFKKLLLTMTYSGRMVSNNFCQKANLSDRPSGASLAIIME
jgi:hypothetical protein